MNFTPAPENDFAEFIQTYYERCRARVPAIEAIAGKWTFEDLIPGFSDFDTRFIVCDGLKAHDWCHMAMQVAEVHYELARERKEWARTLEHLPGVNLMWPELLDPDSFYPEFLQWSFYDGPRDQLKRLQEYMQSHEWNRQDEEFHWKKIALYYGRYDRKIDPPINLGPYEDRYPLHSRVMHYFAPPLHSAVCLMNRQTTPGKLDAFRQARDLFPNSQLIERLLEMVECFYEKPDLLREPGLTELDDELESYLRGMVGVLWSHSELFGSMSEPRTPNELQSTVRGIASTPGAASLFENIKFARLMQGRLWFFAQDVAWFDSLPLIRIELNRIRSNFLEQPLKQAAKLIYNEELSPEECLVRLRGDVLSEQQINACRRFAELADPVCDSSNLKKRAREIADIYEPFLEAMETVVAHVHRNAEYSYA